MLGLSLRGGAPVLGPAGWPDEWVWNLPAYVGISFPGRPGYVDLVADDSEGSDGISALPGSAVYTRGSGPANG